MIKKTPQIWVPKPNLDQNCTRNKWYYNKIRSFLKKNFFTYRRNFENENICVLSDKRSACKNVLHTDERFFWKADGISVFGEGKLKKIIEELDMIIIMSFKKEEDLSELKEAEAATVVFTSQSVTGL